MEWATTHRRHSGSSRWATAIASSNRISIRSLNAHGKTSSPRKLATASASTRPAQSPTDA